MEILDHIGSCDKRITVGAIVNNRLADLTQQLDQDAEVRLLTINDEIGNRIYRRSLFMLMQKAVYDIFPDSTLLIEHSLSNGMYCEIYKDTPLVQKDLEKIKERMNEYVKMDLPIKKFFMDKETLKEYYLNRGFTDKADILNYIEGEKVPVYELDGSYDYFYYNMVPRTGILDRFDFHMHYPGFILLFPQRGEPYKVPQFIVQNKLANVFYEYEKWGEIIGVSNLSELNNIIERGKYHELVRIAESFHEKKIARIADAITEEHEKKRIILISGPSSSGKTTFAQRLIIQLRINGIKPVSISTDDYFVDREKTPRDENGNYDFEALQAIDLELFNEQLLELLQGKRVEIPFFNFHTGQREYKGNYIQVDEEHPIIIEGIHSLNDRLTEFIPDNNKYKIYISALTQINIDRHNRIPTTDIRLIRRLVRDSFFRNRPASKTLDFWPSVRKGEEKNVFPYQENADIMFSSALIYELAVLKKYAEPLLREIKENEKCYYQAQRLLELFYCFLPMGEEDIPRTSILKEFIGGSAFF
ncbi:MAG: nucleoside kinase [Halanaerobiaceae bacterium]|nr:nucleoside kinase [Halanaerobiaceae bacterium]